MGVDVYQFMSGLLASPMKMVQLFLRTVSLVLIMDLLPVHHWLPAFLLLVAIDAAVFAIVRLALDRGSNERRARLSDLH